MLPIQLSSTSLVFPDGSIHGKHSQQFITSPKEEEYSHPHVICGEYSLRLVTDEAVFITNTEKFWGAPLPMSRGTYRELTKSTKRHYQSVFEVLSLPPGNEDLVGKLVTVCDTSWSWKG